MLAYHRLIENLHEVKILAKECHFKKGVTLQTVLISLSKKISNVAF